MFLEGSTDSFIANRNRHETKIFLYLNLCSNHISSDIQLAKAHLKELRVQLNIQKNRRVHGHLCTWRAIGTWAFGGHSGT